MTPTKLTFTHRALALAALVVALVLTFAPAHHAEAKSKTFRTPLALPMGQVLIPQVQAPQAQVPGVRPALFSGDQQGSGLFGQPSTQWGQQPKARLWLASNVDSAYLAGVRDGRFVSLNQIKTAIQAFTGAPLKRVLSISMVNGVLVLSVEDVYSNIFNVRVRPENAEVLP